MQQCHKKKLEILSPFDETERTKKTGRKPRKYEYAFDVSTHLKQLIGTDLTTIPGIDASSALKLISEIGTDIRKWPTAKRFCAWLGLCPGTRISGSRRLNSHTSHSTNRAAIILRMAASGLYRNESIFGAHLRRMKARMGKVEAITATAHKMARTLYYMMLRKTDFEDQGSDYYTTLNHAKTLRYLRKKAQSLGYVLEKGENSGTEYQQLK